MTRHHINPSSGEVSVCRATLNCPFGDLEKDHYKTADDARAAFEKTMDLTIPTHAKKDSFADRISVDGVKRLLELSEDARAGDLKQIFRKAAHDFKSVHTQREILDLITSQYYDMKAAELDGDTKKAAVFSCLQELGKARRGVLGWEEYRATKEGKVEELELNDPDHIYLEQYKNDVIRATDKLETDYAVWEEMLATDPLPTKPYKTGDKIKTTGHEITVVTEDGDSVRVAEILRSSNNVYTGRVSSKTASDSFEVLSKICQELVDSLSSKSGFIPPRQIDNYSPVKKLGDTGFVKLGSGVENNAYLHSASGTVFKIPHSSSQKLKNGNNYFDAIQSALVVEQKRYAQVDDEKLEKTDTEYIKTYFLNGKDSKGRDVGVTAQPYLDPKIYIPYSAKGLYSEDDEVGEWLSANTSDHHPGNVFVNKRTGRRVLVDCLLDTEVE